MRFEDQRPSDNIEDRRGNGGGPARGRSPFGGVRLPVGRGGMGLGGLVLLLVLAWAAGIDPLQLLGGGGGALVPIETSDASETPLRSTPLEEQQKAFVARVLATTEQCWRDTFAERFDRPYVEPKLVLFRDGVRSACGAASSSVGPFYCPGDAKVYLDLSFLDEMERVLGARGDFAQAYVIAHEVGHHVQNLLGTSRKVQGERGRVSEAEYNRSSVRLELQADYFAGCWAHYVEHRLQGRAELEVGDYEEAIAAAQAVGDDTLQRRATGRVMPEQFTHGTAAQRAKWFRLGYESGDPTAHDPFRDER
ncbi:MAG: neutral zinc metallopeptidase [Planctomycetes bacterium]|nr:neutral zinc metallopeptidase [Planctomycetota bacterium]